MIEIRNEKTGQAVFCQDVDHALREIEARGGEWTGHEAYLPKARDAEKAEAAVETLANLDPDALPDSKVVAALDAVVAVAVEAEKAQEAAVEAEVEAIAKAEAANAALEAEKAGEQGAAPKAQGKKGGRAK